MIIWIDIELALAIHDRQLAEHGGGTGIRDLGMLESALAPPQQTYSYGDPPPDLAELAASLATGLAKNHPFVDGNKRTAAVACEVFLLLNGAILDATDEDLYAIYYGLAAGTVSEQEFAAWLRTVLKMDSSNRVQEADTEPYDVQGDAA